MGDAERSLTPFDGIDSKLTVFALANGMDLVKEPGSRRLEWFTGGLERGIVIEESEADGFDLRALAWSMGKPERAVEAPVGRASVEALSSALENAIEVANRLSSTGSE